MTFVHETAHVGPDVELGRGSYVGPHVSIEGHVVTGARCRIEAGARIGQTGHGYDWSDRDQAWYPKAHNFGVVIGDEVHIGSNTCVDRGSWRDTFIDRGTKVDNLVHIAHNVRVGCNCMIIAQAELSGSVVLADRVYIGPHATIRERLSVDSGSIVGMGAVVVKDVEANVIVAGVPAKVFGRVVDWPPLPPEVS